MAWSLYIQGRSFAKRCCVAAKLVLSQSPIGGMLFEQYPYMLFEDGTLMQFE